MDFAHSPRAVELLESLNVFITERVEPSEAAIEAERAEQPTSQPPTIERLKDEAKAAGLWNLCVRDPDLGPGLSMVDYAPLAERLGTNRTAQEATNCDAPTSVNGDALAIYCSPAQRDRWLAPQLDGQIRSAFAMTEPHTASSDASNISMSAARVGDDWVLDGRKWWISGVLHPNCEFLIAVANTEPDASRHGQHTQFIVPLDTPGLTVERNLPKFGYLDADGHVELSFDGVRVPDESVLGEVGGGFAIGQARLGPARVQHCMRTIGVAEQALALMCERVESRETFGAPLSSRSNITDWIAEARIDIDAARLMVLRTAWLMDHEGNKAAAPEMSVIKVLVMRTATTVVDRAIQTFGAAGVSDDTPLAKMYASLRSLRIADGPDEVHLMAIGRRELRRRAASPLR
ncbi:MAG: acyl-CoA dehydrogenase family protein [Actinomycetota bacterium]|jgi:acyl-CoA dehydrogenase|nr:acyl-CoA dehydrogenase family protein [Actinomycetota bacterium]